jgi:threonine/homoserine/homoserine lactone efflux protein
MNISYDLLLAMVLFAFVTSVTPGPNNMMLLASGVNYGFRLTLPHMFGISIGHCVMLVCVGIGFGELLLRFPFIYIAIKVLGFVYMLYLAWTIATSNSNPAEGNVDNNSKPLSFMGAAAFQWVNPKAWVMAIGFFSNYITKEAGIEIIVICSLLFSIVNFPSIAVWALLGSRMRKLFAIKVYAKIFNVTMAALLVAAMVPSLITSAFGTE